MNQLHPSVKSVWALGILIRAFFIALTFLVIELLFIRPNINYDIPIGFTSLIIILLGVVISILYPILKYKYWYYEVRENELFLKRGILLRITTIAPFNRIQHIDVHQNLFERMMNLARLVIYTAGTRGADIIIPGLPLDYAEMLRDKLKEYAIEDAL